MNYLYPLIAIVILLLLWDQLGTPKIGNEVTFNDNKNVNNTNIGFVKPEHRLLKIFNDIFNIKRTSL